MAGPPGLIPPATMRAAGQVIAVLGVIMVIAGWGSGWVVPGCVATLGGLAAIWRSGV